MIIDIIIIIVISIGTCFDELNLMSLSTTHPADHSYLGASCLQVSQFAKSILRLGDLKLPCQLGHTTSC